MKPAGLDSGGPVVRRGSAEDKSMRERMRKPGPIVQTGLSGETAQDKPHFRASPRPSVGVQATSETWSLEEPFGSR